MLKVFKQPYSDFIDPQGRTCKKGEAVTVNADGEEVLREGYQRIKKKTECYYGKYRDASGRVRRIRLCPDKESAKQILASKISEAAKARHGLGDPYEEHRAVPLRQHLTDFAKELEIKNGTPAHRKQVVARLTKAFDACGFQTLQDLAATRVSEWLADLRRGSRARLPLDRKKQFYTVRETAALLQVKPPAIRALVQRHRLPATGQGKARRFPAATVEALQNRLCRGISVQTSNYFVTHLKAFGRFLVKHRRLPENPFTHLQKGRVEIDRRHDRRELTTEEMERLLSTTRQSERVFRGLTGEDRAALYATAASTGFRAAALASLTPESFHLDEQPATVVLAARFNKNRKPRIQPLPDDLVPVLREYLKGKPRSKVVWGGTWASDHRGAEMIRKDLDRAGIPYVVDGPDGPLYADFHALRHTYLTLLGRGGVDLRTAQELAGHSTPVLTARYSHRRLHDLAGAVQKLPRFLPGSTAPECNPAKPSEANGSACPRLDQTADVSGQRASDPVSGGGGPKAGPETTQPPAKQGVGHRQTVPVSSVHQRGRRDSNPQPPDRQSGTLTS